MKIDKENKKITRFSLPSGNVWIQEFENTIISSDKKDSLIFIPEFEKAKNLVINQYLSRNKQPLLVVGTGNFIRQHMIPSHLAEFVIHLFLYPNDRMIWVCGAVATNRENNNSIPIWYYNANMNILNAVRQTLWGLQGKLIFIGKNHDNSNKRQRKLNEWLNIWIYRCPKTSLNDILILENYKSKINNLLVSQDEKISENPELFKVIKNTCK